MTALGRMGMAQRAMVPKAIEAQLRSGYPSVRLTAFESLDSAQLASPRLRDALRQLLELENAVIVAANRSMREIDEGWAEYYSQVLGACADHCNRSDPRVNRTLAEGAYNDDGPFAIQLARDHGPEILAVLLDRSTWDVGALASLAIGMLATVAANSTLTPANRAAIHAAVLRAATKTDVGIRISGVRALRTVGVAADLPFLRQIAEADTIHFDSPRGVRFPVREYATTAIAAIQTRGPR